MGRQQFEDQFKDKLEQREIKPSAKSWEQLAGRLDSAEKKPKPIFWWIGIAATIVGGILIYSLTFNINSNIQTPVIVDAPSEEVQQEKVDTKQKNTILVVEESTKEEVSENEKKSSEESSGPVQIVKPDLNKESQIAATQSTNAPEEKENFQPLVESPDETLINSRLKELIAEVSVKENESGDATEAEIDSLLYAAAGQISLEQNREYLSNTIDAEDLLFDVEMELEQSFRDKVFDLLKEGYTKARTAVANRNY